jgi:hypothetical protein
VLLCELSVIYHMSCGVCVQDDDEDEDDDDDDDDDDDEDETALESYATVLDKEDCEVDEYQIFQNVLVGKISLISL